MQRSKQHALMFLLGATLVGGVVGFSVSYWQHATGRPSSWASREGMYDDLGLTTQQRVSIDSVSDAALKTTHALLAPVQPEIDSVRNDARKSIENLMTPAQRQKFDDKRKEFQERQAKVQAHRDSVAKAHGEQPGSHGPLPL